VNRIGRRIWGKHLPLYISELQFRYDARLTRHISERRLRDAEVKAIGIFVVCVIVIGFGIFSLGYSTCDEPPKPTSKTEQNVDPHKYDCAAPNAAFKVGLYRTWIFVHDYKEEVVAISTVFIAIFTIILGVFTVSLAKATQIAAHAANRSAKAALALELPIIQAEPVGYGTGDSQEGGKFKETFSLQCFDFTNRGRTKAFPIEVRWGWSVGDKLPRRPVYKFNKAFDLDVILKAEDGRVGLFITTFDMEIALGDTERIETKQTKLWLYCCLVYEDFMRTRREIGFCWRRYENPGAGGFILDATPAYNRKT
jgi:hypothetical protein